jgi:SPP1 family predicted phage head-tail adaptor
MIGKLRNRITFKSKTSVSDGAGGFVNTLADYYTCWAEIVRETNNRTNIAGKDSINDGITFRIRYTTSKTFTNALVISYKSNTYMINSIINEADLNQYYLISCSTLK